MDQLMALRAAATSGAEEIPSAVELELAAAGNALDRADVATREANLHRQRADVAWNLQGTYLDLLERREGHRLDLFGKLVDEIAEARASREMEVTGDRRADRPGDEQATNGDAGNASGAADSGNEQAEGNEGASANGEDSVDDSAPPTNARDDEREPERDSRDISAARRLLDATQPLSRSWMSWELLRRAPIILSVELVLVMGALGALLRAASPHVRRLAQFAAGETPDPSPQPGDRALLTLGLHIVFGMATAMVLFVLINVGIDAAAVQSLSTVDDLNPFTMAALGLLGGYASLNVAAWMGDIVLNLLRQPRPVSPVGQQAAVNLMEEIARFMRPQQADGQ
jgi:hypothetical protein